MATIDNVTTETLNTPDNASVTPVTSLLELPQLSIQPPEPSLNDIIWTHLMENAMYTKMIQQHRLGKRADSGFKAEA